MTKLRSSWILCALGTLMVFFAALAAQCIAQESHSTQPDGIIILNGSYLKGPYLVQENALGQLVFNGTPVDVQLPPEEEEYERPGGFHRRMMGRPEFPRRPGPWRRESIGGDFSQEKKPAPIETVLNTIRYGGIAVVSASSHELEVYPRTITLDLTEQLLGNSEARPGTLPESLEQLLPQLRLDDDLLSFAEAFVADARKVEEENFRSINKVRLLDGAAYPLSTLGMLMVVLATGQLLLNRPPQRGETSLPEVLSSNTTRFVFIIIAFSILDLVWTVLASHDGAMKELNPIGSHLTEHPILLFAFKAATTGLAVTILLYLRNLPNANLASWWMCLLLTLLTARWLVFNSLLV